MGKQRFKPALALALTAAMCLSALPPAARAAEDDRPWGWWIEYGEGWHMDEVTGHRFYVDGYGNIHWDTSSGGSTPTDPTDPPADKTDPSDTSGRTVGGSCGDNAKWSLNRDTGVLEITGTGDMSSDYFLGYPLYTEVTELHISDGITSIGNHVFSGLPITSIDLPNSLTHIGEGAFQSTNLTSVTIPDSVTSIGDDAFLDCEQLTYASLPNGLTHIPDGLFCDCVSLTSVEIPDSVKTIGDNQIGTYGAFNGTGLTSVTIPDGVTRIGDRTFLYCERLTSITIPDSVTSFGDYIFPGDPVHMTVYGYAGSAAETLIKEQYFASTITFVSLGDSKRTPPQTPPNGAQGDFVIENGVLTRYQGQERDVTIPSSVTSIGASAFAGCTSVQRVTIPGSVTSIEADAFVKCTSLKSVMIPASVTRIGEDAFLRGVTLYGVAGSYAETYAKNHNLTFSTVDAELPVANVPGLESASDWAQSTIEQAYRAGLVPAALQGQYAQAANRAEFCALATALYETVAGAEITGRASFQDTTDVNVQKMASLGVVNGVGGGNFEPYSKLTREEAATMLARLARALGRPLPAQAPGFADNASISSWAFDAVGQVQAAGVMQGVGNNAFAPAEEYTREQSIATMHRLFETLQRAASAESAASATVSAS